MKKEKGVRSQELKESEENRSRPDARVLTPSILTPLHPSSVLCLLFSILLLSGCAIAPRADAGRAIATAPRDNGTPATAARTVVTETLPLAAGTAVNHSKAEATPSSPAIEQTRIVLSAPAEYKITRDHTAASTGTIDTTVAKHRIDAAQRRILLYAAILALLAGLVFRAILPAWPGLSNGILAAAAILGGAWKFAEIPWWAALIPMLIFGIMALGYKRAEWDANKNLIPDFLEKKNT